MPMEAPDILPQPIPDVQVRPSATPETFGGGAGLEKVGQETQKIGSEAGNILAFEKIRADQTAALMQSSGLKQDASAIVAKALQYKGINAHDGYDEAMEAFNKASADRFGRLKGQAQQGYFQTHGSVIADWVNQRLQEHVYTETEKAHESAFKDDMANTIALSAQTRTIQGPYSHLMDLLDAKARLDGMPPETREAKLRETNGAFLVAHVKTALEEGGKQNLDFAKNMISTAENGGRIYKDAPQFMVDEKSLLNAKELLNTMPKQAEAEAKHQQEEMYKANMRQAMLDMFDGKLTLSEAQRRFRAGDLDKSDYNLLETKLSKPGAQVTRSFDVSNPQVFNDIRQAQLTGSEDPGEIQRMIARGAASGDIKPEDGKYLLSLVNGKPPTPRDSYIDARAKNLRDFGNRYFANTKFYGFVGDKEKNDQETEKLVSDFYNEVDKSKAKGEKIDEIRDRLLMVATQKQFPGLGNLEKIPDIVIDLKGKITQLLNPDQKSELKPRFRVSKVGQETPRSGETKEK